MDSSIIISHDCDHIDIDTAISAKRNIDQGFTYSINTCNIELEKLDDFIKSVEIKLGKLKTFDYSKNKNQICKIFQNKYTRLYFDGNSSELTLSGVSIDEETSSKIWKIYLENSPNEDEIDIYFYSYYMNEARVEFNNRMGKIKDFEYISRLYYPYLNVDIMFKQFFTGPENILLLVGEAGLGKSKLSSLAIKYAYENPDCIPYDKLIDNPSLDYQFINISFVKSIDVLSNDTFWRNIENEQVDFVIIDDLDYMLTKRDAEVNSQEDVNKNNFLNQFLSYTDGVEKNKTKFIITTNQSYSDIDSALLRRGRLFEVLELRKLDKMEALDIWLENELPEENFYSTFLSHEVLPAELGTEIAKYMNTRIGKITESYLLEGGISKIEKAGREKKLNL